MNARLRFPWSWLIVGLAYCMPLLPIESPYEKFFWVGLVSALAYLILISRTAYTTAYLAQEVPQPTLRLWHMAMKATYLNSILQAVPLFAATLAAKDLLVAIPIRFSSLSRAYDHAIDRPIQWEVVVIGVGILGVFVLLDHMLITAITLLLNKHLVKSPASLGKTAIGLRVILACSMMGLMAFIVTAFEVIHTDYLWNQTDQSITRNRVIETIVPAFEPVVTNGIFLAANVLNHSALCPYMIRCGSLPYDTRPFIARQVFIAVLGTVLYGLLIGGVLFFASPLADQRAEKAKRDF